MFNQIILLSEDKDSTLGESTPNSKVCNYVRKHINNVILEK